MSKARFECRQFRCTCSSCSVTIAGVLGAVSWVQQNFSQEIYKVCKTESMSPGAHKVHSDAPYLLSSFPCACLVHSLYLPINHDLILIERTFTKIEKREGWVICQVYPTCEMGRERGKSGNLFPNPLPLPSLTLLDRNFLLRYQSSW